MARFLKKLLSNKSEEEKDSFTSAHLGEENAFYYNEELKQWVMRGEEDKVRESMSTAPPPPCSRDLNYESSMPPSHTGNTNGSNNVNGQHSEYQAFSSTSPTSHGRRVLRSSQLYTNIPGMNVIQTEPVNQPFLNIPTSTTSQFIPSKDDFDASLVNDAYADLMKPPTPTVEESSEDKTEEQ